jgi:hypothetical protein
MGSRGPRFTAPSRAEASGTNRHRGASRAELQWALQVSNLGPPPCKGEAKALVRRLSRSGRVPLSSFECLGVIPSRYAVVM